MADHRASSSVRIGDISGLREELKDDKVGKQRAALLKLLELDLHSAKDLPTGIFRDVLMVRHQDNVEVKKFMYCFFQMTADMLQQSDTVKDVTYNVKRDMSDRNPVVRAMAVRFVGHLTSQSLVTELMELVKGCLHDGDPLVRKTAVMSIGRLYRLMPTLGETINLLTALEGKLHDESAPVAINALAILRDLQATIGTDLQLTTETVRKLLLAMSEGSEWNQIAVLEAVSHFTAPDVDEASVIMERVLPSLNHANSAVVLTAARVLLHQMESRGGLDWSPHSRDWAGKMLKALEKSAASAEASIQWVVMKCLQTILERWHVLNGQLDVRNFFLKYDDPAYIKQQKLEIICQLTVENNVDQVLRELREYAGDTDAAVARRAVECMGTAALRLSGTAEKVVAALMELMTTPKNNVGTSHNSMVQSIIPTMALIFRAYPAQYETVIGVMCDNLDLVSDPAAKSSLLWVIGEYAEFIVDPWQKLSPFCDGLEAESAMTQLAAVTAVTKAYLKVPTEQGSKLALSVLERGTKLDNPDVRHRSFFYWHMLSHDHAVAKDVVLAQRPPLDTGDLDELKPLTKALVCDVPNLAVVYGVDPHTMGFSGNTATGGTIANGQVDDAILDTQNSDISKVTSTDVAALEKRDESGLLEPLSTLKLEDSAPGTVEHQPRPQTDSLIDLLDDDVPATPASLMGSGPVPTPQAASAPANDPFLLLLGSPTASAAPPPQHHPFAQPGLQQPGANHWGQPGLQQPAQTAAFMMMQPQPIAAREAPTQASSWMGFDPSPTASSTTPLPPTAPAPAATPSPNPLTSSGPPPSLPPVNTQPHPGNPFAVPAPQPVTSPSNPFTPAATPAAASAVVSLLGPNSLPPISAQNSLTSTTSSVNPLSASQVNLLGTSEVNPIGPSQGNPYASVGPADSSFQQGGYGGYGVQNANGGMDFRASNGNWPPYSPQTTGISGYGGYVAQHTGGFSQFAAANFVDPRASQQGLGGFGQPIMHQGYTLQHTGGSMYGGFGVQPPAGSLLLRRDAGQGLEIYGQFLGSRSSGGIYFQLHLTNHSPSDLSGFMIQFNKNHLGLAPARVPIDIALLPSGASRNVDVPIILNPTFVNPQATGELQVALKTQQLGTLFFRDNLPMHVMQ